MAGPWEQFQSAAPSAEAPPPGPWSKFAPAPEVAPEETEAPARNANVLPYQVGRGAVAGTLGAPVDFANLALHSIVAPFGGHAPERPFLGSESIGSGLDYIQNKWNKLIGQDEFAAPPKETDERFAHAAGSGIGGVASPFAAIKALSTVAPAIENSKTVGALTNFFKKPTVGTLATEGGLGATSGVGAQGATEAFPGNPVAPLVGGIVAPLSVVGAGRGITAAGQTAARTAAPFGETGQRRIAGQVLNEAALDPAAVAAGEIVPPISGQKPTLAQATRDPGIAGLEQAAATIEPAPYIAQRGANNQAIRSAAEDVAAGDPGAIRSAVEVRQANLTGAAQRGEERATAATQEALDAAGARRAETDTAAQEASQRAQAATQEAVHGATPGTADRGAASEALHRDILSQHAASEAAERAAWAPINEARDLKFEALPIKGDVDKLVGGLTRSERALLPDAELSIIGQWSPTEPFAELTSLKSAVGSAARKAFREGDANKARVIGKLEGVLGQHLENPSLLEGEHPLLTGDLLEKYDAARAVTRAQKQQFNTASETAPIFQRTGTGDVKVAPTETMTRFVKPGPGGKEAFESLVTALGGPKVLEDAAAGNATALNHVRDWAIADIQSKPLTAKNVADWRARYSGMLNEFPTLRADIERISQRAFEQEAAGTTAGNIEKMVSDINAKELNGKTIAALKTKHAETLAQHPEIAADLDTIGQRVARQEQVTARREKLTSMLEKNAANRFTEGDPEHALGQLLKSNNQQANAAQIAEFQRFIKRSPEAAEGARRTMVDMLLRSGENAATDLTGDKFLSSAKMVKFYEKNGRVFDALFPNAEQRQLVDRIVQGVRMNGLAGEGATATGGPNTANKLAGVERFKKLSGEKYIDALIGGGATKTLGAISGAIGAGAGAVGGHLGSLAGAAAGAATGPKLLKALYQGPQEKIMTLVNEALRDPALARDLMREATPRNDKIVGPRLLKYLGGTMVPAKAAASEEE